MRTCNTTSTQRPQIAILPDAANHTAGSTQLLYENLCSHSSGPQTRGTAWHTLRHTFPSRLAMSGQAEGTIAALLRHSTTGLVRRYAPSPPPT